MLGALRGSNLILYTTVFSFREKSASIQNTFQNSRLVSHNPVMRQVRLQLGQGQAQKDEGDKPTVNYKIL